MLIGDHDTSKKVFIIAEAGNCHEGSIVRAEEMIIEAKKAGADAIKFQAITPEKLFSNPKQIEKYKKLCLPMSCFGALKKRCDVEGIKFMATHFDFDGLEMLDSIGVPAFKISSGDNNYFDLIDETIKVANKRRKPTIISLGLLNERGRSDLIDRYSDTYHSKKRTLFLHCVSAYPAKAEYVEMGNIVFYDNLFNKQGILGYSDHCIGNEACLLAVAKGASVIEKHFTLDHNLSDFRDHKLSANPKEFKQLVKSIRLIEMMMKREGSQRPKEIIENERLMRRTITKPGVRELLRP
jgi:sialic acid synthase SpsE